MNEIKQRLDDVYGVLLRNITSFVCQFLKNHSQVLKNDYQERKRDKGKAFILRNWIYMTPDCQKTALFGEDS